MPGTETASGFRAGCRKLRVRTSFVLNITALLDILVILIFFLLKSYSSDPAQIQPARSIQLPESTSQAQLQDATVMAVTPDGIYVDDRKIVELQGGAVASEQKDGMKIVPLFDELKKIAENTRFIATNSTNVKFDGRITLQADRKLKFALLRDIMFTAGQAEFEEFKFIVLKK